MGRSALKLQQRYGPWALVTGASDGIGRAFAEHLATYGLHLVLVARRRNVLEAVAQTLRERHGVQCLVFEADLCDRQAVQWLVDATAGLEIGLVVTAAGFGAGGPFLQSPLAKELEMVDLNCSGVMALGWHLARRMLPRRRGGLVFLSSVVAFQGVPGAAHYAATKAYVQTLAEGLRAELAPLGLDVLAVVPGPVRSGFGARANMRMAQTVSPATVAAQSLHALGRRAIVRPGGLSKLLGWTLVTAPRALRVAIMRRVMAGMTAHQHAADAAAER
jgi:uncharacterized protein